MTICNGLENGYLDGKGGKQSLKYRLTDTEFEEPQEFEFLCEDESNKNSLILLII